MAASDDKIAILQRFVDNYAADAGVAQAALADGDTPAPARRILAGALNYVIDTLDMFPDHYKGLGVADDAMILRLAAAQAVEAGARHEALLRLAAEAGDVKGLFEGLGDPLDKYVGKLTGRTVRGRTVEQILASKDVRVMFEADLRRELAKHKPEPIDTRTMGADGVAKELEKMVRAALKKDGLLG